MAKPALSDGSTTYARGCESLARIGRAIGLTPSYRSVPPRLAMPRTTDEHLRRQLDLARIPVTVESIRMAAKCACLIVILAMSALTVAYMSIVHGRLALPLMVISAVAPVLVHQAIIGHPTSMARKRAANVLRGSTESMSLMTMSIRHEPSVPNAIRFASESESEFSGELRMCVWDVIMGRFNSFEAALYDVGCRWSAFGEELKMAVSSLLTAVSEKTEEGKRRALDRANHAMVMGAKRRIEEYALSLSTPSMLLFGLGILLPIMVGAFLPMLSWDIWSTPALEGVSQNDENGLIIQTGFLMNLLFPAVALLVAMEAVSRHPLERSTRRMKSSSPRRTECIIAITIGCVAGLSLWHFASNHVEPVIVLLAFTCPTSIILLITSSGPTFIRSDEKEAVMGDMLFRMGARMLEGENFESALENAATDSGKDRSRVPYRIAVRAIVLGQDFNEAMNDEDNMVRASGANDAMKVVKRAAEKDEQSAGLLAMDLATYIRDLSQIESMLKSRLRPIISMMRMTAHVMGPVVLGITYSIYMSLESLGGGSGSVTPGQLVLVLGIFLAEINAVVCFFVWGIEGGVDKRALQKSTGVCILVSQLIFAATVVTAT